MIVRFSIGKPAARFFMLILLATLCACSKTVDLQSGLKDADANEIVSVLNRYGIDAQKRSTKDGMTGKFFVFGRTSVYGFHGREKITLENVVINAFVRAGELSFNFITKSISPEYVEDVYSLIEKLKPLAADEIPTEPGFCINRGIILDPLDAEENEMITMFATPPGHPDIAIRLNTMMNLKRIEESLLARDAKNDIKLEYPPHFKTLREGKRTINGIEGEELLERVREFKGTSAHDFMWVGLGKMKDVLAPTITLELDTGKGQAGNRVNSSLSGQAVLELWERISSCLRVRPTSAPGKTSAAFPPPWSLGELTATGYACPQTGWWECVEDGQVQGERRRHFQAGERMPHASLWGEPNLWQKLKGERPVYRTGTVWQLVAYGDPPPADAAGNAHPPSDD